MKTIQEVLCECLRSVHIGVTGLEFARDVEMALDAAGYIISVKRKAADWTTDMKIKDVRHIADLGEMLDGLAELQNALNGEGRELHLYAGDGDGTMYSDTAIPLRISGTILGHIESLVKDELKALGGEP